MVVVRVKHAWITNIHDGGVKKNMWVSRPYLAFGVLDAEIPTLNFFFGSCL
jgi:hypothetical protein